MEEIRWVEVLHSCIFGVLLGTEISRKILGSAWASSQRLYGGGTEKIISLNKIWA